MSKKYNSHPFVPFPIRLHDQASPDQFISSYVDVLNDPQPLFPK